MKKIFLLGAMVCALAMMTACKSGTTNDNTSDTLQKTAIPDYAPNIKYLQIIDSLDSCGWFEEDTLWLMYDNDNYQRAAKPRYINGVPIVWLSHEDIEGDKLPTRHCIDFGYEFHGDSCLCICVYDVRYDGDFKPDGATHSFYPIEFLDSILNAQQIVQEQPEEVIFEFDANKVRQRYADAERKAREAGHKAGEMMK